MRKTIIFISILLVVAALGWGIRYFLGTFTYTRHIDLPPQLLASSSTDQTTLNASSTDVFGQTTTTALNPASSTVDRASWKTYSDNEWGFSVSYPSNLAIKPDISGTFTLVVPKDRYFQWPLLDDVTISVVASSSCPVLEAGSRTLPPATLSDNGYSFIRQETSDVGAGNIYRQLVYDMVNQGVCYRVSLFDHGTNGAGFYVGDQALISQYETQHQANLDQLVSIFMGVVDSFRIIETPAGTPEDQVSPQ
jgi:hypothetical protein